MSFCSHSSQADNWPGWRGPTGSGVSTDTNLPLEWDSVKNIRWKVRLPGPSNSTPIVWENKVFLNQATKEGDRQLHCYNRLTGEFIWKKSVPAEYREPKHPANPYCQASPVTDGERVINFYGSPGIYCYDLDGKKLWHRKFGKLDHMFGQGPSPVIYKDLCIMIYGPSTEEYVIALNKKTGETVWKMDIPKPRIPLEVMQRLRQMGRKKRKSPGKKSKTTNGEAAGKQKKKRQKRPPLGSTRATNPGGIWATPLIVRVHDRDEMIMSFPHVVAAYDPATGKQLWECKGNSYQILASPCFGDGLLAVTGGAEMVLRIGGQGDVTKKNRLWYREQGKGCIGSAVIFQGHIYFQDMRGIMYCYELKTGKTVWRKRLANAGRSQGSWSSVMLGDGKIYAINKSGDVFVMKAAPKFVLLATNSFGEGETTNASIIAAHGDLFVRTDKALWCVRSQK